MLASRPMALRAPAAAVATLLLFGVSVPSPAPIGAADGPDDRREALEEIRNRIGELEEDLGRLEVRRGDLDQELRQTEVQLELQERRVDEAVAARDVTSDQLGATLGRVEELERRLRGLRDSLGASFARLYRLGRDGSLRIVAAAIENPRLLASIRSVRYIVRKDREAFDEALSVAVQLGEQRDELEARQRELDEWASREEERRADLLRIRRRQSALAARLESQRRELALAMETLAEREERLQRLVDLLGDGLEDLGGAPIQEFQGVLDWPVEGTVTVGFGPRRDPRYRTVVPHNGLDIAVREGATVRAVYPGEVLYAAPFEGFGLTAVVHHAGRVFSLYARLEELRVEVGDVLTYGGVIGRPGESIYFEIRESNQPRDPAEWLR